MQLGLVKCFSSFAATLAMVAAWTACERGSKSVHASEDRPAALTLERLEAAPPETLVRVDPARSRERRTYAVSVYRDLLHRPASDDEVATVERTLALGVARSTVVLALMNTQQYVHLMASEAADRTLGRLLSAAELSQIERDSFDEGQPLHRVLLQRVICTEEARLRLEGQHAGATDAWLFATLLSRGFLQDDARPAEEVLPSPGELTAPGLAACQAIFRGFPFRNALAKHFVHRFLRLEPDDQRVKGHVREIELGEPHFVEAIIVGSDEYLANQLRQSP